jgi:hypothetical protein
VDAVMVIVAALYIGVVWLVFFRFNGGYSQLRTVWVRRLSGWYERHFAHLDSRAGTHFFGRSALVWTGDHWIACLRGRQIAPRIRGNVN